MKIAVLGTGLMGAPMARNLAAAGHDLTVWNRSPEKARALGDIAHVAANPARACEDAEVVLAMLLDGPATKGTLQDAGAIEAAGMGALIIDMGSVDPPTDRALAAFCATNGRRYLDAPVSGGVKGAEDATLAIFVGGDVSDFEAAAPVFAPLGGATHMGPTGAGQVAKLANQLIVATGIGAVAEAFSLVQAAGIDPAILRKALRGGFADSRILDLHGARMIAGDFVPGGRSAAQLKDLDNVLDTAADVGIDLPLAKTATAAFRDLVENHGGGELDHAAYFRWLELRGPNRS